MDQWFMESYLRWLGQASDEELVRRKDEVAVALLHAGIDSMVSRLLSGLLAEEVDARDQLLNHRRTRLVGRRQSAPKPESKPESRSKSESESRSEPKSESESKPRSKSKSKSNSESESESNSEPNSEPKSEPEPEPRPKPKPEPKTKPKPKRKVWPGQKAERLGWVQGVY